MAAFVSCVIVINGEWSSAPSLPRTSGLVTERASLLTHHPLPLSDIHLAPHTNLSQVFHWKVFGCALRRTLA